MVQFKRGKSVRVKVWSLGGGNMGVIRYRQELEKEVAKHFPHWWLLSDLWSNKRYVDSEISRNPLRNLRRQNTRIVIPETMNAVSTGLKINTPVTKESLRMVAIFNIALTYADHYALYESCKYLLSSAYVPGTILRSRRFYRTKKRDSSSRSLCFYSIR